MAHIRQSLPDYGSGVGAIPPCYTKIGAIPSNSAGNWSLDPDPLPQSFTTVFVFVY